MADGVAFIDGEYSPAHEARIPLFDLGFTRGDAVYDTVSVWNGRFFRLDDHVARFLRSCAGARLTCPHPPEELKRILAECVHRAGLEDSYVQMIVTRGEFVSMTKRDPRLCRNRFVAFALPYIWIVPPGAAGDRHRPRDGRQPPDADGGDRPPREELQLDGPPAGSLRGARPRAPTPPSSARPPATSPRARVSTCSS